MNYRQRFLMYAAFLVLAAIFAAISLAIDCPPTTVTPVPPDVNENLINYKLICVQKAVEGESLKINLAACDPDGDPIDYRLLQAPNGMVITQDANEAVISWPAEYGTWYVDVSVFDYPSDPDDTLSDFGTIVFQIRRQNRPPVFGGCS